MHERMSERWSGWPSGWAIFVGAILLLAGVLNLVDGLVALLNPRTAAVSPEGLVIWNLAAWGWIQTVLGVVMVAVSFGLFTAQEWARWIAIVIAVVNAIAVVGFFTAYPLWAALVIALDVIVIYQLSMHWKQPAGRTT
jgi:hypothetical protein